MAAPKPREAPMNEPNESDQMEPAVEDGFHVHDPASANWVVRKVVEARQYGAQGHSVSNQSLSRPRLPFRRLHRQI